MTEPQSVPVKRGRGRPPGARNKPKDIQPEIKQEIPAAAISAPVNSGKDPLDILAGGDPKKIIALLLWRARHRNPEMSELITEKDLAGFTACVEYLGVTPEVRIVRPNGRPAQPALPEIPPNRRDPKGRPAVPARPAEDPRPFVVVSLVEKGTENVIKPVENNEEDYQAARKAAEKRRAKETALQLVAELQNQAATGNFSTAVIGEAALALAALARE